MNLNLAERAFLFPAISILFLAYTNRYRKLAGIIRSLNQKAGEADAPKLQAQKQSLHLRVRLIKYMQAAAVVAFMSCICSMISLAMDSKSVASSCFYASLFILLVSLVKTLVETLLAGVSLKMLLNRKIANR